MKQFWQSQILQAEYYSEGDIQTKLVSSLLPYLGYSSNEWRQDFQSRSVILIGQTKGEQLHPHFFIETREPDTSLDVFLPQFGQRLAEYTRLGVRYGVLTNGRNFQVCQCSPDGKLVYTLKLNDLRSNETLLQVSRLLGRDKFEALPQASRARIISIYNNKGGVGKTTISINLSAALAQLGYRVLLVDLDAQANSTLGLGLYPPNTENRNIASFLNKYPRLSFQGLIWKNVNKNEIDLLPSNIDLYQALREFQGRDFFLKEQFSQLPHETYDFILMDTPPAMDRCFNFSVRAADYMVIPSDLKPFSIYGLTHLVREVGQQLKILGVVGNNVDLSANIIEPLKEINSLHKLPVFDQIIHSRPCLSQSSGLGLSIFQMEKLKKGNAAGVAAIEFKALAREILMQIESDRVTASEATQTHEYPTPIKAHSSQANWTIKSKRSPLSPSLISFGWQKADQNQQFSQV